MARSHYRGTVYGNTPTGAKPLPGAAIRLYHPDTGQPWALPVYPDPVNGTPYALPIYTSVDGELELWADDPARVACHVSHRAYHGVGEVIEIRPDPETQATDEDVEESVEDHEAKTNPHDQYLTQGEGDFLYKPVDWEPDLTDYYTKGEADDEFLDQDEGDLRYEQLSRKGMPLGYVPLDPAGLIPNAYLPPLAISDTFVVISEAEMLALPAQKGDIAVRLDTTENYVLAQDPATVLANWTKLAASTTAGNTTVLRREEFTPTAGTNTVALAAPPTVVQALSRNGVGQSQPAGHFSVSGVVVTFSDPFVAGERVAVVYEIGSSIPAPVNGYTKEESDLRYEPIDTMYTKAESDTRYLQQAAADTRYLQLIGGTLTGTLNTPALNVASKPVNVSPDSGNALVWRANGFYSSGSGGNVTVVNREEFFPAAAATTVTLAQAPTELLSVSRNGVDQFAGSGDYSLAGAVITFTDAFVAGEKVSVLSEVGTSVPVDAYTTAQSEARYVNVTGDSMTGPLTVTGTTEQYGLVVQNDRARASFQASTDTVIGRVGEEYAGSGMHLSNNLRTTASSGGWQRDDGAKMGAALSIGSGTTILNLASVTAGGGNNPATLINRMQMLPDGSLYLNPDNTTGYALLAGGSIRSVQGNMWQPDGASCGHYGDDRNGITTRLTGARQNGTGPLIHFDTGWTGGWAGFPNISLGAIGCLDQGAGGNPSALLGFYVASGADNKLHYVGGWGANGQLGLAPGAGQNSIFSNGGGYIFSLGYGSISPAYSRLASSSILELSGGGGFVTPSADNQASLGHPSWRWGTVYAVTGSINTSTREAKDDRGLVDPEEALAEVLRVPVHRFTYKTEERVMPEDVSEEGQAALRADWEREEVYRRYERIGFMAEDAAIPDGDALLLVGPDSVEPQNTAGVLMAAIQALAAQVADLKARLA